jgi:alkylation response protein AidB-like acyl-CoA dehydrogenase
LNDIFEGTSLTDLNDFRMNTRAWLQENCPESMRTPMPDYERVEGGDKRRSSNPDSYVWLERMMEKGWTVPNWPLAYGGAGLNKEQYLILLQEMAAINARPPLIGMGVVMIGPTLLEYGNEEQKLRHLPAIARGETRWCQGYSEPGAGSDLASLQTRAVDNGEYFSVNGQKLWTSGAHYADWMFALVRTDPDTPKHEGISFVLLSLDSSGVTVRPIPLLSGVSHFCETFLDDVQVPKADLVHELNKGWSVGKRLLQHERSGIHTLAAAASSKGKQDTGLTLVEAATTYAGLQNGKLKDLQLRTAIAKHQMDTRAFALTQGRSVEESRGGTPGAATSMFKLYGAHLNQQQAELQLSLHGTQGLGWKGDGHSKKELRVTRHWLNTKSFSIAGGSKEIQKNIIAKRVLELPD